MYIYIYLYIRDRVGVSIQSHSRLPIGSGAHSTKLSASGALRAPGNRRFGGPGAPAAAAAARGREGVDLQLHGVVQDVVQKAVQAVEAVGHVTAGTAVGAEVRAVQRAAAVVEVAVPSADVIDIEALIEDHIIVQYVTWRDLRGGRQLVLRDVGDVVVVIAVLGPVGAEEVNGLLEGGGDGVGEGLEFGLHGAKLLLELHQAGLKEVRQRGGRGQDGEEQVVEVKGRPRCRAAGGRG